MKRYLIAFVCIVSFALPVRADDLTVLSEVDGAEPKQMINRYLMRQVGEALQRCSTVYEALKTPQQLAAYQERMRSTFIEHLGGFPERTPLHVKVVGTLDRDGYLLGKSFVGTCSEDLLVCARYLAALEGNGSGARIDVVAIGAVGLPALHAVALQRELFDTLNLKRSLSSWSAVVRNPAAGGQFGNVVHGALRAYDLPNLLETLPPEKVEVEEAVELSEEPRS